MLQNYETTSEIRNSLQAIGNIVEFFRRNFSWPKPVGRTRRLPNRVKRWIQQPQELLRARRIMEAIQPDSHPIEVLHRVRALADETSAYESDEVSVRV